MSMEDPTEFEARPGYRRMGIYLPALVVGGLAMLALVYLLAMRTLGWPVPDRLDTALPPLVQSEGSRDVVLFVSPTTQRYFTGVGGNYEVLLSPWRKHLSAQRWRVTEASTPEALSKGDGRILIVPSAVALSPQERSAIEAFKADGGSVLLTWASGTRDDANQWTGWEWLERMGQARVNGEVAKAEDAPGFLVLDGESPVNRQQGAGLRIWLGANHEPLLRLMPINDAQLAGRFMDWARTPAPADLANGAIVLSEDERGVRSVVLGFSESTWEYQPHRIAPVIEDALAFLGRRPEALLANWPAGHRAAQIVEMDTEDQFSNALHLASLMDNIGYRGTFYVLTSMGMEFPDVVKTLARSHEVAFHGEVHTSFKDLPEATQRQRLETMQAQLATALPSDQTTMGFRAPTEGYDGTTERLLAEKGFTHHLADPHRSDARLPLFAAEEGVGKQLVVLPRTQRDDINLLSEGTTDAVVLAQRLGDELALAESQGALGILSVHTQNFAQGSPLASAVSIYLHQLASRRETVWLASAGEVAAWWRDRDRVRVVSRDLGLRAEFDLSVTPGEPLDGVSVVVMLPRKNVLPTVRGAKTGMPPVEVTPIDPYRASVRFGELPAGNYHYQITF
ncbi:polysaccharide deacetylase family protein [Silanimonas sp.]|uniref:polysaccharide deacetylase family protein n=1 Tax=Silanimonas sp. TaxID=1929290 RepID=UPI0022C3CDB4|nr:polysaccharide deacetylase family protein [Silanimonas sp.]MCZ8114417.1 polysaccharide deacetylase family protein [Silanimonas sp.]